MKKKFKLTENKKNEDEIYVIGIVANTNDYKFIWQLNNKLYLNLKKRKDIEITRKESVLNFSFYDFFDEQKHLNYFIISNKSEYGYLISRFKQFDFFIIIKGIISSNELNININKIKSMDDVVVVYRIDIFNEKEYKTINNLI